MTLTKITSLASAKRIAAFFAALLVLCSFCGQTASALTPDQLKIFTKNIQYYNVDQCGDTGESSEDTSAETGTGIPDSEIPGKNNEEKIWNYLRSLGFNKKQTAGIMGNIGNEGVYDPQSIQDPYGRTKDYEVFKTLTTTDKGYGLVGFTPGYSLMMPNIGGGADWSGISKVKVTKDNFYYISTQLDVVYGYMKNTTGLRGGNMLKEFQKESTSAAASSASFLEQFERPQFYNYADRAKTANEMMKKYGSNAVQEISGTGGESSGGSSGAQCCSSGGNSSNGSLVGSNNEEKVWNYFKGKGLDDHLVAGIMGNISQESGFDPTAYQGGGNMKDPTPLGTAVGIGKAWGLIQWDAGGRAPAYAKDAGIEGPIHELGTQLDLIWWHLTVTSPTSQTKAITEFKKAKNPKEAASSWEHLLEGAGTPRMENRWAAATAAMNKYGGTGGGGSSSSSGSSSDSEAACTCEPSGGKTVVLDPGHSGSDITEDKDPSGIVAYDYYNSGETEDMWKVSQIMTKKLENEGYKVINTKKSAKDTVGLIERARIANGANADIAVSLHSDTGKFGTSSKGWVIPQEVGLYRQSGTHKKTFSDKEVAKTSQEYAQKIVTARKAAEGDATLHKLDFTGRTLPATGNISIVQLFSKVPWVYNEVGQTGFNANKYAEGITEGIKKSLGESSDDSSAECSSTGDGDLSATVKAYAWPEYKGRGFITPKPEYKKAIKEAQGQGRYVGGTLYPGIDCGGFVTLAMVDSGYEPNYNFKGKGSRTGDSPAEARSQWNWLDNNWRKINPSSTKDLKPGDVAINSGHTYMYVGKIDGFNSVIASASWDQRAPMAGEEAPADPAFSWYRKE